MSAVSEAYHSRYARRSRGELKEYAIGVAVLDRPPDYDPRIDPAVRLEARRLRLKLAEYYQTEGLNDHVLIELPKGGYVPAFRFAASLGPSPQPSMPAPAWSVMRVAFGVVLLLAGATIAAWPIFHTKAGKPPIGGYESAPDSNRGSSV